jgi:hypothetical protein
MGGVTYSTQYTTDSKETLEKYYKEHHDFVKKDPNYLRKMLAFRTELEVI